MGELFGVENRKSQAPAVAALEARVTTLETTSADHETRIDALEAAGTAAQQIYTCPMGATVLQLVYVSGSGTVDLADASDVSKMKDVQFIASKSAATTCTVVDRGELGGFVGLTPGAQYYADPAVPGGITTTEPDPLTQVVQPVGTAKSATVLDIVIAPPPRIEP